MEEITQFTDATQTDNTVDVSVSSATDADFQEIPEESSPSTEETAPTPEVTETPAFIPETMEESTTPSPDDGEQESESVSLELENIQNLLSEIQKEQTNFNSASLETQTQITEEHQYFMEQSKNVLSILVVIALILGFASGIILARLVWRKI